jgi:hypothetical protein
VRRSANALLCVAAGLLLATTAAPAPTKLTLDQRREMKELLDRLKSDRNGPIVSGAAWTMIHCAGEPARKRAEKLFKAVEQYNKGNEAPLAALGGAAGLRRGPSPGASRP